MQGYIFCLLNFSYYFANPLAVLDIRHGGLSIHGAIIAGIFAMIWIARRAKIPVMSIIDALSCSTILGQSVGRWGNYFNSEAYGMPVASQKWGLFIPESRRVAEYADYSLFHPAFLYESALDFLGFFILLFIYYRFGKKYCGLPFFAYLILYSVIRYFIEQIRIDSALNIGGFPVAEIVSVILFLTGIAGVLIIILKNYNRQI